jgi:Mg2+ and Co2+ transporter CorA
MSSRDFDLENFDNDVLIIIKIIAFAWTKNDAKEKKKSFFYKMINFYFLNDEENAQTFKKRKMKIIKNSRRSRIEKFKTMIWTETIRS